MSSGAEKEINIKVNVELTRDILTKVLSEGIMLKKETFAPVINIFISHSCFHLTHHHLDTPNHNYFFHMTKEYLYLYILVASLIYI